MIDISKLKKQVKEGLRRLSDSFLSKEIKAEFAFNNKSLESLSKTSKFIDSDLNSFWKPVESQVLTSKDYKRAQSWTIGIIVFLFLVLLVLFFSLLSPKKKYKHIDKGTVVLVQGEIKEDPRAAEQEQINSEEELLVQSLSVEGTDENLAKNSPLLQSESTNIAEYEVKAGDTLEKISYKFYGKSDLGSIEKIKVANKIHNTRFLRIGQKLILPL
jgi:nucleoid-associated protein YgaU